MLIITTIRCDVKVQGSRKTSLHEGSPRHPDIGTGRREFFFRNGRGVAVTIPFPIVTAPRIFFFHIVQKIIIGSCHVKIENLYLVFVKSLSL